MHLISLNDFRMTSTVDEEIIRKRLLLDGEGAGDDRKLTMILKSFLKVILIPRDPGQPDWKKTDPATVPVDGRVTFQKCIVRLNLVIISNFRPYFLKPSSRQIQPVFIVL